jgi:hypothetical protein
MAMSINYCVVAVNFLAQRFPSVIWSKRIRMQYCSYEALRMFSNCNWEVRSWQSPAADWFPNRW